MSNQTANVYVRPLRLSCSDAIVTVLAGCAAADGNLRTEEGSRMTDVLSSSRWALGLGVEATAATTTRALNLIADHGLPVVLAACAEAIPAELRATAFALAVDVALADGRLGIRESTLIDQLQNALRVDSDLARKIVDVLLVKNRAGGRPDL
jgi:tellurite resistance protein